MQRWQGFRTNKGALGGLGFLVFLCGVTSLAWTLAPHDPWSIVSRPFTPPTWEFPLGTDTLGRDILAAIIHGGRVSLLIGLASAAMSTVVGILMGAIAAYYGGWVDEVLMRITEFFQIVPGFVLALVLIAIFTPSLMTIVFAIGFVGWPAMARLVRAEFLSLRTREFVLAAQALGAGDAKLMFRTILPNAMPVIIVYSSLLVATSILFESSLSFLGLGDPNYISWGYMIGASRSVLRLAWWMPVFPGLAILLTVLSINLVGDGLNDALNPKSNRALAVTASEQPPDSGAQARAEGKEEQCQRHNHTKGSFRLTRTSWNP